MGPINIDDVQCVGDEDNLLDCTFNPSHNCVHFEDAGVTCPVDVSPTSVVASSDTVLPETTGMVVVTPSPGT